MKYYKYLFLFIFQVGIVQSQDNWPPSNLEGTLSQQVNVHLSWMPPQDPSNTEIAYDDGILGNATYFNPTYEQGYAHGSQFSVAGDFSLSAATVKIISEGDAYWPWPNATHGPVRILIFDDNGGIPGNLIYEEEAVAQDGWATIYPDISNLTETFYIIISHAEIWDEEGFGIDSGVDYGDRMFTLYEGIWSQGDVLNVGGDYMVRAVVNTNGGARVLDYFSSTPEPGSGYIHVDGTTTKSLKEYVKSAEIAGYQESNYSAPIYSELNIVLRDLLGYNVYRDDEIIDFVVPNEAWDNDLSDGTYTYFVTAVYDEGESEPSNTVEVEISYMPIDILIVDLDPTPTGQALKSALENVYSGGIEITYSLDEYSLIGMDAVFVLLGVYSNNTRILVGEETPLIDYINSGGNLYLEGGDVWAYDPGFPGGYDFGPHFGINPVSDGSANLSQVTGYDFLDGMSWNYSGENNYIDHIDPLNDDALTPAVSSFVTQLLGV